MHTHSKERSNTTRGNQYFCCLLLITIPWAFFMRYIFLSVHGGGDDIAYSKNAFDIIQNNYQIQAHPFSNRFGMILPVAVIYKLFGVNEYTSVIYPCLCSLANLIIIFISGRLFFNIRVGILSVVFLLFLPLDVIYSTLLMPDLIASTFISICSIIFLYCEKKTIKWESILYFVSGLSLGWAYLVKEFSLFFITFLIVYMIIVSWKRKAKFEWVYLGIGILIPITAELAFYFLKTGTILCRVRGIETIHNVSVWSGIHYHGYTLWKRLFFDLLHTLFENRLFSFYFFFVSACIIVILREKTKRNELGYFALWFGVMFLNLNFCSTSLKSYNVLQPTDRYMYLLFCPGIIMLAYYLNTFSELAAHGQRENLMLSLTIPVAIMGIFNFIKFSLFDVVFISFILIIVYCLYVFPKHTYAKYYTTGIMGILIMVNSLPSQYMAVRHLMRDPCNERDILKFVRKLPNKIIYTDNKTKPTLEYLNGYKNSPEIRTFHDEKNVREMINSYVLVNMDYLMYANKHYHKELPSFLGKLPPFWKELKHFNSMEGYGYVLYDTSNDKKNND